MNSQPGLFAGHFAHIGYVTGDARAAAAAFEAQQNISGWRFKEQVTIEVGDGTSILANIAKAKAGDILIELIEPLSGNDGIYRNYLGQAREQAVFHHLAFRLDSPAALEAARLKATSLGATLVLQSSYPDGTGSFYADTRHLFGHYIECYCPYP
ncbi:MAG: VOC family protein [Phyllobacteriaceae bacterium]|nr:VOC family protein [Phyllobacteriaceae bacterium]